MRTVLFFFCLLFSYTVLIAQTDHDMGGVYKRYWHPARGVLVVQTLKLSGTSSGRYTLTEEGCEAHDFTSGYWIRTKIWRRHTDSMQVVILDYENKYNARYLEIERTGCLTPISDYGNRAKWENSFAPVKKWHDQ
ncbi:MAG: hypothetical protein ACHQD8_03770 [Chitinophagales bacterium]